jgi:hypothetical protein
VTKTKPDLDMSCDLNSNAPASCRTTADRYRQLLTETMTPALAQHLCEMIVRCEALAREGEARD